MVLTKESWTFLLFYDTIWGVLNRLKRDDTNKKKRQKRIFLAGFRSDWVNNDWNGLPGLGGAK